MNRFGYCSNACPIIAKTAFREVEGEGRGRARGSGRERKVGSERGVGGKREGDKNKTGWS